MRAMEWRSGRGRARVRPDCGVLCNGLSHGALHSISFIDFIKFLSQRRILIDEPSAISAVSQATYTFSADKITSNSPAQKPAHHQLSPPDALPPPSSLTRPGSPILIGSYSEGSLTAEIDAPLWTGEEVTNQCTSFAEHLAATAE